MSSFHDLPVGKVWQFMYSSCIRRGLNTKIRMGGALLYYSACNKTIYQNAFHSDGLPALHFGHNVGLGLRVLYYWKCPLARFVPK